MIPIFQSGRESKMTSADTFCKNNIHDERNLILTDDTDSTKTWNCKNCTYEITLIRKDCIVCDSCNMGLSDENFIATGVSYWFADFLYCKECFDKYKRDLIDLKMKILEGDSVANTELAMPIKMEMF